MGGYFFLFLLIYNASLIMLIIKLSNVITVVTFIQLTSISGGRFEGRISQKFYTNCAVRFFVRAF